MVTYQAVCLPKPRCVIHLPLMLLLSKIIKEVASFRTLVGGPPCWSRRVTGYKEDRQKWQEVQASEGPGCLCSTFACGQLMAPLTRLFLGELDYGSFLRHRSSPYASWARYARSAAV
eukprot:341380-Pelagomonas_calceolata.AAC.6